MYADGARGGFGVLAAACPPSAFKSTTRFLSSSAFACRPGTSVFGREASGAKLAQPVRQKEACIDYCWYCIG